MQGESNLNTLDLTNKTNQVTVECSTAPNGQQPPKKLPQIQHLVLSARVQVHVPAQLVHLLPRRRRRVRVEAPQRALLHELQPPWRREPEDPALVAPVRGGHHDRHRLLQHRLVAALGVDVHGRQEARLGGVGVDPAQRVELPVG